MITSGSALKKARMILAKSSPILGFASTCRNPCCVISTGSSAVHILTPGLLIYPLWDSELPASASASAWLPPQPVSGAAGLRDGPCRPGTSGAEPGLPDGPGRSRRRGSRASWPGRPSASRSAVPRPWLLPLSKALSASWAARSSPAVSLSISPMSAPSLRRPAGSSRRRLDRIVTTVSPNNLTSSPLRSNGWPGSRPVL